jgi:hypothetical protein
MKASEKRLFLILCTAVFLALNLLCLRSFLNARKEVIRETAVAKNKLAEDKGWVQVGETLRAADTWITAHPMPQLPPDDANAQLLKSERDEAEKAGMKIAEENLLTTQEGRYGSTAGVSIKLGGPFSGIVRLLYALQAPGSWRTVEKLTLRSDAQPPNVIADLEIRQHFLPGTASASPAPTTP